MHVERQEQNKNTTDVGDKNLQLPIGKTFNSLQNEGLFISAAQILSQV
jgi:hypothetical protein